jgi:hypothetical protein
MKQVALEHVKDEYQKSLKQILVDRKYPTIDELIDISLSLFLEIKVKGVLGEDKDGDGLLFQYGTYDWGNGEYFQFDITRQFIMPDEDETYQLSMKMYFEPVECKDYNCWSFGCKNLEKWFDDIKKSEGYRLAKDLICKKFEINFWHC